VISKAARGGLRELLAPNENVEDTPLFVGEVSTAILLKWFAHTLCRTVQPLRFGLSVMGLAKTLVASVASHSGHPSIRKTKAAARMTASINTMCLLISSELMFPQRERVC
jgi:hypothetical protein